MIAPPRRRADLTVDHPTTTLEELFLRIVRESDLHPGRRKVAADGSRPAAPAAADELAGSPIRSPDRRSTSTARPDRSSDRRRDPADRGPVDRRSPGSRPSA